MKRIPALLLMTALGCASRAAPPPRSPPPAPARGSPAATRNVLDEMISSDMGDDHAFAWSARRPLAWSDFQGTPPTDGSEGAKTSYSVYTAWRCRGRAFEYRVVAGFRPRQSWVKAIVLNDTTQRRTVLAHEQTHFDIAELHARRMRRAFGELARPCSKSDDQIRAFVRDLTEAEKAEQRRYDSETNHGLLPQPQAAWSVQTRRRLAASN